MGFYIFGIFIYYYGFFIAIGVSIAFLVGLYLCKKFDTNFYDFLIFSCSIALFAIVGAKTTYILISYKNIDFSKIIDFRYISYLMRYGFVFYGGVLFAIFGYFFIKKYLDIDKNLSYFYNFSSFSSRFWKNWLFFYWLLLWNNV